MFLLSLTCYCGERSKINENILMLSKLNETLLEILLSLIKKIISLVKQSHSVKKLTIDLIVLLFSHIFFFSLLHCKSYLKILRGFVRNPLPPELFFLAYISLLVSLVPSSSIFPQTREQVPSQSAASCCLVLSQLTKLAARAGKMDDFCGAAETKAIHSKTTTWPAAAVGFCWVE